MYQAVRTYNSISILVSLPPHHKVLPIQISIFWDSEQFLSSAKFGISLLLNGLISQLFLPIQDKKNILSLKGERWTEIPLSDQH